MNDLYGFIITRHVNSELTNKYWNHSVKLLKKFYPFRKIVIIDDNSNYDYIKADFEYQDVEIIQSEFNGRGELLPYYYLLKRRFFKNAIIIHDSIFFHKRIAFEKLNGINVIPLWFFNSDKEDIENRKRITRNLNNYRIIESKFDDNNILAMNYNKWFGCFGVQSYINLEFLDKIERKYGITKMLSAVHCRRDRCCLERIFGCIFVNECHHLSRQKSLLGNIMKYHKWGYTFNEYMNDFEQGIVPVPVVKIWTGR